MWNPNVKRLQASHAAEADALVFFCAPALGCSRLPTPPPRRRRQPLPPPIASADSHHASSFGRKVARSRSVGCGSRSFSGDFLERISTGFGDCTLRRVESQREAMPKIVLHLDHDKNSDSEQQRPRMRERIKCGGLFGGFGMMSAYWLTAASGEDDFDTSSRTSTAAAARGGSTHGRARSWGLAFASPMRTFRPYSSSSKSLYAINNATPATNIISSINSSNKLVNDSIKPSNPDGNASFMAAQS